MSEPSLQPQAECYIGQFSHKLPHSHTAQARPCGHVACDPHTITYFGSGDDPEREGDYCMVCFGRQFNIWPDKLLLAAVEQDAPARQIYT